MSYRTKLLARGVSAVAPNPLGSLSEPLLSKKDEENPVDVDEEEEQNDPWSSVSVIVGAVVLGAAG